MGGIMKTKTEYVSGLKILLLILTIINIFNYVIDIGSGIIYYEINVLEVKYMKREYRAIILLLFSIVCAITFRELGFMHFAGLAIALLTVLYTFWG